MTATSLFKIGNTSRAYGGVTEGVTPRKSPDAIARFLEHCRVGKCLSPHTIRAYRADLMDFARHIGDRDVANASRDLVREYARMLIDERSLKSTTVRRRIATLKVLYHWMERESLVAESVFHRLDLSIRLPRRLPRSLQSHEMRSLLDAATDSAEKGSGRMRYDGSLMHFVLVALFTTGLRIGELLNVGLADVSARDGSIQVRGKGNRERRVYMLGELALDTLDKFLQIRSAVGLGSDRLLVNEAGMPVSAQHVRLRLRALAERAHIGRRVTPHMLRHTAATQLLEAGVDIRYVQSLLGHTSITTTQMYTDVRDAALRETLSKADTLRRLFRAATPGAV